MSLSVALQVAQSALTARQTEASILSRNIAGANDAGYTRKSALISTLTNASGQSGGLKIEGVGRVSDTALFRNLTQATAVGSARQAMLDGLEGLSETIGDPELGLSPAARLGELVNSVQQYSAKPEDSILAQKMLQNAYDMAETLRTASDATQQVRATADEKIADSVKTINSLLSDLESLNQTIIKGTQSGQDVTDALDNRDRVLLAMSEEMGIRTQTRANNDIVVTTDSGVVLFETVPREVKFTPTNTFAPGVSGSAVFVDGVNVAGPGATMPVSGGKIAGLTAVRDDAAVTYQNQLDELAHGLIEVFSEPLGPGLFIHSSPGVLTPGVVKPGLATTIDVNPLADPEQPGGSLDRLRDGGFAGPSYNPGGEAGFSDRLQEILGKFDDPMVFDIATKTDPTNSLTAFAGSSVSWLEGARKQATSEADSQSVVIGRTAQSLSNATGVNIDEEMQRMLDIERSYGATAKLMSAIDGMLQQLMAVVR